MRRCKYFCLRFFLVKNLIAAARDDSPSGTEIFVKRVLRNFQSVLGDVEYAIRIVKESEGLFFGKVSKKSHMDKHDLTPVDVVEQEIEDWPYAEFVCEPYKKQLIVIRMNGRLFQTIDRVKALLAELFSKEIVGHGYDIRVEPVVKSDSFWQLMHSSAKVYCVDLKLLSPNLFGAGSSATKLLKDVHEVCNNTDIEIRVTSDEGGLRVKEENFGSFVKYAEQGGGTWQATVEDEKGVRTVRSGQSVKEVHVSASIKDDNKRLEQAYVESLEEVTLPNN